MDGIVGLALRADLGREEGTLSHGTWYPALTAWAMDARPRETRLILATHGKEWKPLLRGARQGCCLSAVEGGASCGR